MKIIIPQPSDLFYLNTVIIPKLTYKISTLDIF